MEPFPAASKDESCGSINKSIGTDGTIGTGARFVYIFRLGNTKFHNKLVYKNI
jgi:hypothetical protein